MKIAVLQRFLPSASRGGVGHFTHGLANALVNLGHQVTVFSRDPAPEGAFYSVVQVAPHRLKTKWDFFWFPFDAARIDFSGFDLVHAQGDDQWIPRRLPIVRTMHGSSWVEAFYNGIVRFSPKHFLMHLYFYLCEFIAHLRANMTVGVSADTLKYYFRIHRVIPNGIDTELFRNHGHEKSSNPAILFVGQLQSRKRGDLLVKIFKEIIRPALPQSELWLVSPEAMTGEGIQCFQNISSSALAALYSKAWVFCLPSSYEGFGRPYVEAMAAGTAVVAAANPGAREVLDGGKFGVLSSAAQMGNDLLRLLKNPAERKRYEELGRERARKYDWAVVATQYEQIYRELIRAR